MIRRSAHTASPPVPNLYGRETPGSRPREGDLIQDKVLCLRIRLFVVDGDRQIASQRTILGWQCACDHHVSREGIATVGREGTAGLFASAQPLPGNDRYAGVGHFEGAGEGEFADAAVVEAKIGAVRSWLAGGENLGGRLGLLEGILSPCADTEALTDGYEARTVARTCTKTTQ